MLLVLGFAVVVTLLKLVTSETKLSRLEQNYSTALDAAKGAADVFDLHEAKREPWNWIADTAYPAWLQL